MKNTLKKIISVLCIIAVLMSLGVMTLSFDAGAYVSGTVKTWETVVETLTMNGEKGVTGSQGGGSYTADPHGGVRGTVYKLQTASSPSFQVGNGKNAVREDTDAYNLEAGVTYKLTFEYMWGKGSAHVASNKSATLGVGLVWGSRLNGTDSSLASGVATRKKFASTVAAFTLNSSNATLGTNAEAGKDYYALNSDTEWLKCEYQFTTSGDSWNNAYKYLMIQNESDNSVNNGIPVNNATLYVDNIKLEKLTSVSAANKMQVAWENVVETLNMENGGITGNQGTAGSYTDDPRDEGHGRVYQFTANSSDSAQIGKDNNASAIDTDAFRMDSGVTYKLAFDYMWGKGSTSAVYGGVYSHDICLVWGTNLMYGSGTRKQFSGSIAPSYVLDDTNSTAGTTEGGTAIRTQTHDSEWYHCEYTFTTSTDFSSGWTENLTALMIQNECNGDGNRATIYLDNIRIDRAVYVTANEAKALYGDTNLDGTVNSSDAIYLLYNTIYPSDYPVKAPCDYNDDDKVNSSDAVYLAYHAVFGNEQYPIKGKLSDDKVITSDVKYLDADGKVVYRVFYPYNQTMGESAKATSVANALTSALGSTVSTANDRWVGVAGSSSSTDFEILIGNTKRPESSKALEYLTSSGAGRNKDYVICTINNKIVINATTEAALAEACNYFKKHFVNKSGVAGGINFVYSNNAGYTDSKINGVSISKYKIISQKYARSYMVKNEINNLISGISENVGYNILSYDDDAIAESDYEIIIGECLNRQGTETALSADIYSISVKGKKVYLSGGSAHSLSMAVSEFNRMISEGSITNGNSTTANYNDAVKNYDTSEKYTLAWGDDFNHYSTSGKNGISTKNWRIYGPGEYDDIGYDGRKSVRGDTPDVVQVKDGQLQIRAKYDEQYYYGAMLTTERTMAFKYGYVEIKMRMPKGVGYWIAFWTGRIGADGNGPYSIETDIIEMNSPTARSAAPNIHGWGKTDWPGQYDASLKDTVDWSSAASSGDYSHWVFKQYKTVYHPTYTDGGSFHDEMHTFGYFVTPEKTAFTMDGEEYITIIHSELEDATLLQDLQNCYQYLRISQATCFNGYGNKQEDDDPDWFNGSNAFDVDYVHVYQLQDGIQKLHLGGGSIQS